MTYDGLNASIIINDSDFFYRNLNRIINIDKSKRKNPYYIKYSFMPNTEYEVLIKTNIKEMFLKIFYKTLLKLNRINAALDDNKKICLSINQNEITTEMIIVLNKSDYEMKKRIINGKPHDISSEHGKCYNPPYEEKVGNIRDLKQLLMDEIKELLSIQNDLSIKYEFDGVYRDRYIEINNTYNKLFFICQLEELFEQYKNYPFYFEGHIFLAGKESYEIGFVCANNDLIITTEDKKEIKYDEIEFDSFVKKVFELINKGKKKAR